MIAGFSALFGQNKFKKNQPRYWSLSACDPGQALVWQLGRSQGAIGTSRGTNSCQASGTRKNIQILTSPSRYPLEIKRSRLENPHFNGGF